MTSVLQTAKELWKVVKADSRNDDDDDDDLSVETCRDLLQQLEKCIHHTPSHKKDTVLKTLAASQKTFRVQKRRASGSESSNVKKEWDALLKLTDKLTAALEKLKDEKVEDDEGASPGEPGEHPSTVSAYLARLKSQKKELYKNPPVLPPAPVTVESSFVGLPKRDKKTGTLTFVTGQDQSLHSLLKDFHPNKTPEEVLRGGAFGGTYFRSITSAVTNQKYTAQQALNESVPKEWIEGLDAKKMLTSQTYHQHVNKYQAKCGGSLGMWESSGWISNVDPYGWFQWYCRFYQGRRCSDDARQISRWKGVAGLKGRFRSQLCNKILAADTSADDRRISPVIRQTLWHWGLEITDDILEKHQRRK